MEEEKQSEQQNTDSKVKEAINNELSAYMNPQKPNDIKPVSEMSISEEITRSLSNLNKEKVNTTEPTKIVKPIIKTYKSDAEETIKSGHISSINMAIAESNRMLKRSRDQQGVDPEIKKIKINKMLVITSILLILGGAMAIGIPYFLVKMADKKEIVIEENISKSIITPDLTEKINIVDLNQNRVATTLKERVDQSYTKIGQVKNIYLTEGNGEAEKTITSTKFLNLIKAVIPPEIELTLKPQYMFGMHNYISNQRFLILKTGSYDRTFSGMLLWETDLWQDFKEIFNLESEESENAPEQLGIEIKRFQDAIFSNKDCRVVKNSSGEIVFLLPIINDNTVVITTNTNTLKEIINRVNKATTIATVELLVARVLFSVII